MDHNLKKKKRRAITLVVVMIASIVLGLIVMFISQFGGLETLTPIPVSYTHLTLPTKLEV